VLICPIILEYGFSYSLEPALQAGFFVILSVSLALVVGLTGQISLGHAAFFGIGAYSAAILATRSNLPAVLTIPAGSLVGLAAGFLIGYPVLKLKSYYLALATLGIGIAVQEFFKAADFLTGGEIGIYNLPNIRLGNFELSSSFAHYYVVWMFALIIVFFCDRLSKSFLGKRLRAIHSDEGAAECVGIDAPWTKVRIFAFSAAIAAFAGTLFAHCSYGTIDPGEFGVILSIKIITMVVIGGMYSVYGAVMGAVIIALLPEMIRRLGDLAYMDLTQITHLQDIAFGAVLVIFVIFAPQGIIGKMRLSKTNA
jgi:branched-chain amino acid transport system permease protein